VSSRDCSWKAPRAEPRARGPRRSRGPQPRRRRPAPRTTAQPHSWAGRVRPPLPAIRLRPRKGTARARPRRSSGESLPPRPRPHRRRRRERSRPLTIGPVDQAGAAANRSRAKPANLPSCFAREGRLREGTNRFLRLPRSLLRHPPAREGASLPDCLGRGDGRRRRNPTPGARGRSRYPSRRRSRAALRACSGVRGVVEPRAQATRFPAGLLPGRPSLPGRLWSRKTSRERSPSCSAASPGRAREARRTGGMRPTSRVERRRFHATRRRRPPRPRPPRVRVPATTRV
jgi:hypothetical protein